MIYILHPCVARSYLGGACAAHGGGSESKSASHCDDLDPLSINYVVRGTGSDLTGSPHFTEASLRFRGAVCRVLPDCCGTIRIGDCPEYGFRISRYIGSFFDFSLNM